tara:strand:+ start:3137 stop:3535 length:399 start_codon:yes stop_codon:yes gene_type:complete
MRFETRSKRIMEKYNALSKDEKKKVGKIKFRELKKVYVVARNSDEREEIYACYKGGVWKKEVKRLTDIRNEMGGSADRLVSLEEVVRAGKVNGLRISDRVLYGILHEEHKKRINRKSLGVYLAKGSGFNSRL